MGNRKRSLVYGMGSCLGKMKVFIAESLQEYHGWTTIEVFSTREKAEAFLDEKYERLQSESIDDIMWVDRCFDKYMVEEWEVN